MLVCMLAMYIDAGTTDIPSLTARSFAAGMQLFLGFLASFAGKCHGRFIPGCHAHVEAPTADRLAACC